MPDGIRVDEKGNLYVAAKGVAIYHPEGKLLTTIPTAGDARQLRFRRRGFPDALHHGADFGLPRAAGSERGRCSIKTRHHGWQPPLSAASDPRRRRDHPRSRPRAAGGARQGAAKGYWSLPGGVLETGETLEEGVRREVLEETGLEIELLAVVEIFERIMRDAAGAPEYHYVLIDYMCRVTGGTLSAADDVSRAEWVPRRRLPQYRITEGTLPVIEKAFREPMQESTPALKSWNSSRLRELSAATSRARAAAELRAIAPHTDRAAPGRRPGRSRRGDPIPALRRASRRPAAARRGHPARFRRHPRSGRKRCTSCASKAPVSNRRRSSISSTCSIARRTCKSILNAVVGALPAPGRARPGHRRIPRAAARLAGKILPDGTVADHASVALARLRRDIEKQKKSIQDSLERFLRAHQEEGVLQEEFVTIRNERFVVPVIAGQRRRIDGVIHGASSSGHTLFVEPLETIDLNNELVRLTEEEDAGSAPHPARAHRAAARLFRFDPRRPSP